MQAVILDDDNTELAISDEEAKTLLAEGLIYRCEDEICNSTYTENPIIAYHMADECNPVLRCIMTAIGRTLTYTAYNWRQVPGTTGYGGAGWERYGEPFQQEYIETPFSEEQVCPECGAEIDEEAYTCPECGADLSYP